MFNIILGKDGAQWFSSVLDEILKLPLEHKIIWSFREVGKVFVLQKHKNYWGQYIAITSTEKQRICDNTWRPSILGLERTGEGTVVARFERQVYCSCGGTVAGSKWNATGGEH